MNRRLNSVYLNETQGNPFQPDVNYRGYTASPLLGTPEGISVYMDGLRLNQPFGDVVSWDLIPRIAISEMTLMPGSNPVFGLNTLGGALSLQSKDGSSKPGTTVQASGGMYGRRAVEFDHGWANSKGWNWYIAGNLFHEDGWRVASPTDVRQIFSKLGWQNAKTFLSVTFGYADNFLTGNGLQEQRFLARDYSGAYTIPDHTNNRAPYFNLTARHIVNSSMLFSGNAYYRYIRADTFNADLNDNSLDESLYQLSAADIKALTAGGYTGFPISGSNAQNTPFPYWRCIAQALQKDDPDEKCNGLLTHTYTRQHNYGVAGQLVWNTAPHGRRNQLTGGFAWDRSTLGFQQAAQFGYLNPDRSVTPVDAYLDGSTSANGTSVDTRVDLSGRVNTWSLYATDTITLAPDLVLTLSGRFNRTTIHNRDLIDPGGGPGSLDGNDVYSRFNPSVGVTYSPVRFINVYGSYSEGSRVPTAIELGCADPNQPCKLPNAMAGDPPLQQVVTRTFEAGIRNGRESKWNWNAGWFRAVNHDDILFLASTQTGYGYFKNFGETLRQGFETSLNKRIHRATLGGSYTYLSATYQSTETFDGASNSTNDAALSGAKGMDGVITVVPGDRIPLIPHHMLKAFADYEITSKISLHLNFIAVSSSYARGNENNLSQPDGVYYLGPGTSPGYGVVNFGAHYQASKRLQFFVQINNLLDHHYYTAAQLGSTGFTNQGTFIARPLPAINGEFPVVRAAFYAPGAPITVWGGIRLHF
jgi:outer membrane receptor protein involved in Fe transport